jgi:hypothetical protein
MSIAMEQHPLGIDLPHGAAVHDLPAGLTDNTLRARSFTLRSVGSLRPTETQSARHSPPTRRTTGRAWSGTSRHLDPFVKR